jgi:hypothetical protein
MVDRIFSISTGAIGAIVAGVVVVALAAIGALLVYKLKIRPARNAASNVSETRVDANYGKEPQYTVDADVGGRVMSHTY